jgi:peptide subunit release factor 1 (eRF1)
MKPQMVDVRLRLTELAKVKGATPIISVYLDTRWADEHQRDRVRIFLKNEIRRARQLHPEPGLADDLLWIEAQGDQLVGQVQSAEADGVALFACGALGLREVLPVRVPFENAFVVADRPFLRPLATLVETTPSALIVLVTGERARLVSFDAEGAGEEVVLESDVPGQHRRGGWAQLAQSRYQRHILDHRARHFEAVAETLRAVAEENGIEEIVLAGEPRTVAAFRKHLPRPIAARVVGSIPAEGHQSASELVPRSAEVLAEWRARVLVETVDAVLTEAAKSGQAVAGLEALLEAVGRGAVHRLYLIKGFGESGGVCTGCAVLQRGSAVTCRLCGQSTDPVELADAIVARVVAAGGAVDVLEGHAGLARVGGAAARLRYPL